jgi:hypothetical protein
MGGRRAAAAWAVGTTIAAIFAEAGPAVRAAAPGPRRSWRRRRRGCGRMPRVRHTRLIGVLSILALACDLAVGARALPEPSLRVADPWSAPIVAGGDVLGDPYLAFGPQGAGALVWSLDGGGGRALALVPPGTSGAPRAARALSSLGPRALDLRWVGAATADGGGRLVVAGQLAAGAARATAALEADPSGPFGAARPLNRGAGPLALANYLTGEVALAAVAPAGATGRVVLRLQSAAAAALGAPVILAALPGTVSAVAVGLDWRGDALVAWQQNGLIYARERRTSGTLGPLQVLGGSSAGPRLGALISDDGRGIVAWTDETASTPDGARTASTRLSISGESVRFGRPTVIEAWTEPAGLRLGAGAMRLIRLANGRVVLGWTGWQAGRLVARVAAVTLTGLRPPATVSDAGTDAQLTDLAAGARGEVLAVFTATEPGALVQGPAEIEAAVGVDEGAGQSAFAPPEPVAAGAAGSDPTAAFEPVGDRPVIAWRTGTAGAASQVHYVTRAAESLP